MKTPCTRFQKRPLKRTDGIPRSISFGVQITADHNILISMANQEVITRTLSSCKIHIRSGRKKKRRQKQNLFLWRLLLPFQSLGTIHTYSSRKFSKACQILPLDSRYEYSTSFRNQQDRRKRRVKEGTATSLVPGVPKNRTAMDSQCCLRNVHDKMDDGKTAYENIFGVTFDRPISSKDEF